MWEREKVPGCKQNSRPQHRPAIWQWFCINTVNFLPIFRKIRKKQTWKNRVCIFLFFSGSSYIRKVWFFHYFQFCVFPRSPFLRVLATQRDFCVVDDDGPIFCALFCHPSWSYIWINPIIQIILISHCISFKSGN